MSLRTEAWGWAQRCASPGDKLVLLALASIANDAGRCHPPASHLVTLTGLTVASVRASLKRLEAAGLISRTRRISATGFSMPTLVALKIEAAP